MARIWSSGFELNSTTANVELTTISSSTIQTSVVRSGTYAQQSNSFVEGGSYQYVASATQGLYIARWYYRLDDAPAGDMSVMLFRTGGGGKVGIRVNSSGALELWNIEDSTQIGSDSSALTLGQWYRVELSLDTTTLATSAADVRIDGTSFASGTANLAGAPDRILWGDDTGGSSFNQYFDDIAINDSTGSFQNLWPGEGSIIHLRPNAAGDNTDFSTNADSNWEAVDEVTPDDTTTRNSATSLDDIDDYNLSASGLTSETINCVQVGVRYAFTGDTTPPQFVTRIKATASGTVEESSAISYLSTAYHTNANAAPRNYGLTLYDLPGASTTAWTPTELDTAQIGVRISTGGSSNAVRISTMWLLVDYVAQSTEETAAVSPLTASFTTPSVTATHQSEATVSPLTASFTTPGVTATYVQEETAGVIPLTATFSIPAVTGVSAEIHTATVSPLTATFSLPAVSATTVITAGVSPLTATFTIPEVGAVVPASFTTVIPATATPTKNRKVLVIIESRNPTFRYATEDWDFTEITREINGSSMVRFRTDQLTNDIANAITDLGNRVTVRISTDDTASAGLNYFSGYIPTRQLNLTPQDQSVEIVAFGFASRLFDIPFRSGTTVAIDHSSAGIKASDLAEDVIDNAVALDAQLPLTYSTSTIDDSTDTIKDKFILQNSGEVLNRAVNLAFDSNVIWHWFVDGDSKFYFKKNSTTADHNFVFGRDITSFPIFTEDMQRAVNEVLVVYNGGANIKRVVDQDSIDSVGLRSMTVNETNIPDSTTATEVGNSYLAQRDLPIRSITVTVSDPYHIESINPGDTCRIDNMDSDISGLLTQNLFITRTSYRRESVDLELSLKHPFLSNQIELIRRRFEKESTESIAATIYA
jgi:hypothetical protein